MSTNPIFTASQVNQYNAHTVLIEQQEKDERQHRSRIAAIDTVMRDTVQLRVNLSCCQLEIVEQLLNKPEDVRDFETVPRLVQEKLAQIREDHIESFNVVLSAREACMENGRIVDLTREKKEELRGIFAHSLDESLQEFRLQFKVGPHSNLQQMHEQFATEKQVQIEAYEQMLHSKTPFTMHLDVIEGRKDRLKAVREALLNPNQITPWVAAQQGNLPYLQEELQKVLDPLSQECQKRVDRLSDEWFLTTERRQQAEKKVKNEFSESTTKARLEFVNAKKPSGFALLHLSVLSNHLDIVQWLLEQGADPNLPDAKDSQDGAKIFNYQPLHYAAKLGYLTIVQALLDKEADPNGLGGVCEHRQGEDSYKRTPLHMATHNGHPELVALLLQKGAFINATTDASDQKKTPLHEAVLRRHLLVVTTLVRSDQLDVNIPDASGCSPLYHAVCDGSLEIATLIVGHSSWKNPEDPNDKNRIEQLLRLNISGQAQKMRELLQGLPS